LELDALVREKDFAEFVNDCELLDELLNFLGPSSYDCFPQLRHMDVDDKTYLRVNVLFPEAALQAPGINVKSDLEFAALLKNKWSGNHCTLYSFGRGPVYEYYSNPGDEGHFILTMKGYKPSLEKYGEEDLETLNDKAALEFSRRVFRDTAVMWQCEMKVATVKLSNVRSSRLPKKGLRDSPSAWKKTSQNMARKRSLWRACCRAAEFTPVCFCVLELCWKHCCCHMRSEIIGKRVFCSAADTLIAENIQHK
ncbi:hypothetical protein CSKR_112735, partial [Clonorchis sinensis]